MAGFAMLPKRPVAVYPWFSRGKIVGNPNGVIIKLRRKVAVVKINIGINDREGFVFFFYDLQPFFYSLLYL